MFEATENEITRHRKFKGLSTSNFMYNTFSCVQKITCTRKQAYLVAKNLLAENMKICWYFSQDQNCTTPTLKPSL